MRQHLEGLSMKHVPIIIIILGSFCRAILEWQALPQAKLWFKLSLLVELSLLLLFRVSKSFLIYQDVAQILLPLRSLPTFPKGALMALCPIYHATISVLQYTRSCWMWLIDHMLNWHQDCELLEHKNHEMSHVHPYFLVLRWTFCRLISLLNTEYDKYLLISCSLLNTVLIAHDYTSNIEQKRQNLASWGFTFYWE